MKEKRYFSRIEFTGRTTVTHEGATYTAELHDISLKGALIYTDELLPFKLHDTCNIALTLPGSDVTLSFECEVVHQHNTHVGLKFFSVSSETLTHLRKLVELNLGDHEKTSEELSFWLKS